MLSSTCMNKPQLAKALAEKTKAPQDVAAEFIDALFDTITEELEQGEKVTLGNFGTFFLVRHKERATAHPTSKKTVDLPALTLAKFRPSELLKEKVNQRK